MRDFQKGKFYEWKQKLICIYPLPFFFFFFFFFFWRILLSCFERKVSKIDEVIFIVTAAFTGGISFQMSGLRWIYKDYFTIGSRGRNEMTEASEL